MANENKFSDNTFFNIPSSSLLINRLGEVWNPLSNKIFTADASGLVRSPMVYHDCPNTPHTLIYLLALTFLKRPSERHMAKYLGDRTVLPLDIDKIIWTAFPNTDSALIALMKTKEDTTVQCEIPDINSSMRAMVDYNYILEIDGVLLGTSRPLINDSLKSEHEHRWTYVTRSVRIYHSNKAMRTFHNITVENFLTKEKKKFATVEEVANFVGLHWQHVLTNLFYNKVNEERARHSVYYPLNKDGWRYYQKPIGDMSKLTYDEFINSGDLVLTIPNGKDTLNISVNKVSLLSMLRTISGEYDKENHIRQIRGNRIGKATFDLLTRTGGSLMVYVGDVKFRLTETNLFQRCR